MVEEFLFSSLSVRVCMDWNILFCRIERFLIYRRVSFFFLFAQKCVLYFRGFFCHPVNVYSYVLYSTFVKHLDKKRMYYAAQTINACITIFGYEYYWECAFLKL